VRQEGEPVLGDYEMSLLTLGRFDTVRLVVPADPDVFQAEGLT
jgi:hypothetical protein